MFNFAKEKKALVITLSDNVTAGEVTDFYNQFTPALNAVEQVGLVIDMTKFDDMTADAIRRDIPLELGLLSQLGKMPRMAIVSDKQFIGALFGAVNPLVPMIDIRVFASGEMQAALEFASDLPDKKPQSNGAHLLDSSSANVIAFEIDGYINDVEMATVAKEVNERIERGDAFNALVRLKSFGGFNPEILTDGSFFKMKFGAAKMMEKYAIVTDEGWIKPLIGFAKMVTGIDMRQFPMSEEQAAWDWIKA